MGQPHFSAAGEPITVRASRSDPVTEAVKCISFVILLLLMAFLIVWGTRGGFGLEPPSATESPPSNAYGSFAMPIASPVVINIPPYPDTIMLITPTAMPLGMQTPKACSDVTSYGETCRWVSVDPTPALPLCETPVEGQLCEWRSTYSPSAHRQTTYGGTPDPVVML